MVQRKDAKAMMLTLVTSHSWEHYGNLVTYMRLKGIVPPSKRAAPAVEIIVGHPGTSAR